jgi:hypothetical protein
MGGMKSGTGDVWGDDEDEDEAEESIQDDDSEVEGDDSEVEGDESEIEHGGEGARDRERTASSGESRVLSESPTSSGESARSEGGTTAGSTPSVGGRSEDDDGAASTESSSMGSTDDDGDSGQPYVVRRMLKDKSVQFERDERLTLFVHDDVKAGEQELEAHAQELFGRDIPVFDIREAVYRAALRNRDVVVDELEEMGYTRD